MGARQSAPVNAIKVHSYGSIKSDYAAYSNQGITDAIRETDQALKPLRAKTAPSEDLELERRKISQEQQQSLVLIQLALFIVFLSLLSYVVLPIAWAHGISFLLLCVGIASGFFLRR